MRRPANCDCHCETETLPVNCLGCTAPDGPIPNAWQLDFPAALSYLGETTGSCTGSQDVVGVSPLQRLDVAHQFEYPDISSFGLGTVVEIDQAPVTNPAAPVVTCVWGSNDFYVYEEAHGPAVAPTITCPAGMLPFSSKGSDILQEQWWQNRFAFQPDLIGYGLTNRTRTVLAPTSSDCGYAPVGCEPGTAACAIRVFGIYARMRVETLPMRLVIEVVWIPRRFTSLVMMRQSGGIFKPLIGYAGWNPADVGAIGGLDTCGYSLYPYATATQNIGSGVILRYSRTINCSTDLTGSPLVFTKIEEPKQRAEATQSIVEASGITGVPDEITMTPIA